MRSCIGITSCWIQRERGTMANVPEHLIRIAHNAKAAQRKLAAAQAAQRTAVIERVSVMLEQRRLALLADNELDLQEARSSSTADSLIARLHLDDAKLENLRAGLASLASSPDPIGRPLRRTRLDDGLELTQVASPLGVLLVIFESRPDAVIQIGALAIRSGNAVILKGGREAAASNRALVATLQDALEAQGLPREAVQGIVGREDVHQLLQLDTLIDLVIPRGSGELVRSIRASTRIPVLGHADGICIVYLDESADLEMAKRVVIDGKCDYPAACNATETLLVHASLGDRLQSLGLALRDAGVEVRADARALPHLPGALPAADRDGFVEYGAKILAVRTVDRLEDAIAFINEHGSGHTDAIVASHPDAAERFLREVDSASVFHNASTRFADGYRYGLGAEVGISTSRIHARGPVGVDGLMTTRWLLRGSGQGASEYGSGRRAFAHESLPLK